MVREKSAKSGMAATIYNLLRQISEMDRVITTPHYVRSVMDACNIPLDSRMAMLEALTLHRVETRDQLKHQVALFVDLLKEEKKP